MVADVSRRNLKGWKLSGEAISRALLVELEHAPTGSLYAQLMQDQVTLIKSIPLKAAERIHQLATSALTSGARADTITAEILRTGQVSAGRARTIARTEVSRSANSFTQARAQTIGSDGYIWRSSGDGDVRPTHRKMNGKYVRWDSPPKTDAGLAPYHAGCGPNCRCFPEPIIPD
jgi:SPP1 gp7 family putative phage head morphogenesis protein